MIGFHAESQKAQRFKNLMLARKELRSMEFFLRSSFFINFLGFYSSELIC